MQAQPCLCELYLSTRWQLLMQTVQHDLVKLVHIWQCATFYILCKTTSTLSTASSPPSWQMIQDNCDTKHVLLHFSNYFTDHVEVNPTSSSYTTFRTETNSCGKPGLDFETELSHDNSTRFSCRKLGFKKATLIKHAKYVRMKRTDQADKC